MEKQWCVPLRMAQQSTDENVISLKMKENWDLNQELERYSYSLRHYLIYVAEMCSLSSVH